MPRAKGGPQTRRRHKRILKLTKGFVGRSGNCFVQATQRLEKGLGYAFRDRKVKKRLYRNLWTVRINAQARENGLSYSRLIHGLKTLSVALDRKALADVALHDPSAFAALCDRVKASAARA